MGRVLVVDDDPLSVKVIAHKLARLGHEVHTAPDGQSGIDVAHRVRPDLVLVDWIMPGMCGPDFCRLIRASGFATIPVVLLTARARPGDVEEALGAGATAFVTKPFSPRELAERVAELLGSG